MPSSKKKTRKPNDYVTVGRFLREARLKAGLTQVEASLALGYSNGQFISNFERGLTVPPLKKLKEMVPLYKMNPNKLLDVIFDAERAVMLEEIRARLREKKKP